LTVDKTSGGLGNLEDRLDTLEADEELEDRVEAMEIAFKSLESGQVRYTKGQLLGLLPCISATLRG